MTFKFVLIAALVACVRAGGPASYSISAPSISYGHVGSSHENTVKGLYGQNVLSQYSKAVDSAHSSVRVASSRYSNDGLHYGAAYAAPAYAAHAIAAPAYASHAIAAPAYASHAIAAPIRAYAAPAYGHAYAAPAYGHAYGAHGYAAPAISAHGFAAHAYAAPAIAHAPLAYGHAALGYKAPIAAAYAAPYAASYAAPYAYKAPVAAVHAGGPIVHTSFAGLGASYAW